MMNIQSIIYDYYNSIKKNQSGKDLQVLCVEAYLLSFALWLVFAEGLRPRLLNLLWSFW